MHHTAIEVRLTRSSRKLTNIFFYHVALQSCRFAETNTRTDKKQFILFALTQYQPVLSSYFPPTEFIRTFIFTNWMASLAFQSPPFSVRIATSIYFVFVPSNHRWRTTLSVCLSIWTSTTLSIWEMFPMKFQQDSWLDDHHAGNPVEGLLVQHQTEERQPGRGSPDSCWSKIFSWGESK